MSRQSWVGLFTLLGTVALLGIYWVLAGLGTRSSGYKTAIRFDSAAGLRPGSQVYLSGVPIGIIDRILLERDYSADVILAVKSHVDIPRDSKFLIQAPLTGDPNLVIVPPRLKGATAETLATLPTLPHEIRPYDEQPKGTNPTTVADLLSEGQGEIRRLDAVLSQLEASTPAILRTVQSTLDNANAASSAASIAIARLSNQTTNLMDRAGNNVIDLTDTLNATAKTNSARIDTLLVSLNKTSIALNETVESIKGIAGDKRLHQNIVDTTQSIAETTKTIAAITGDLRQVTGNPQTQAQLRDTIGRLDATAQKLDSLMGTLGGRSNVYGVDPHATPYPYDPNARPNGRLGPPYPAPTASAASQWSLPAGSSAGGTPANGTFAGPPAAAPTGPVLGIEFATPLPAKSPLDKLGDLAKSLAQLQVRVSMLTPQRSGSANTGAGSPLLTSDRGPQSDVNLMLLPRGKTSVLTGVNDLGAQSTYNFAALSQMGKFKAGGGVIYSQLGVLAKLQGERFGLEGRLYDLRHTTFDAYGRVILTPQWEFFAGERDLFHIDRRSVFGLQFQVP
jgi:ABC-type transporter Mla subunit MlaD